MPLIELEHIKKIYNNDGVLTEALHDVSFSIDKGDFVAIMGPSGSGKSTLLHILGFLDPATSGTYLFEGRDASHYDSREAAFIRNKKMGFIFQSFNLLPKTSVLENVKLPLLYSDVPEEEWNKRALRAINAVGLGHRIEHESSELSGGEKQRVAIARALVNDPEVIFADEPTGNLDSKSGQIVMEAIESLNSKGHTIILITHETGTAEHAERIIHVKDGAIERDEKVRHRKKAIVEFVK